MSWIEKLLPPRFNHLNRSGAEARQSIPAGLWLKCPACEAVLYRADLEANLHVCPKCGHHLRIRARARLDALLDAGGRHEIGHEVLPVDPLKFKGSKSYPARLQAAMEAIGETDALIVVGGAILSVPNFARRVTTMVELEPAAQLHTGITPQLKQYVIDAFSEHKLALYANYLEAPELERIRAGASQHGAEWMALIAAVHRQLETGADPASPTSQSLARARVDEVVQRAHR